MDRTVSWCLCGRDQESLGRDPLEGFGAVKSKPYRSQTGTASTNVLE